MATDIVGSKQPQFASDQLKPSKAGYGQNQFGGASSDLPNEKTRASLDLTPKGGDPALDVIRSVGSRTVRMVNEVSLSQEMSRSAVPIAHGMRNPNAGNPTVPGDADGDDQ